MQNPAAGSPAGRIWYDWILIETAARAGWNMAKRKSAETKSAESEEPGAESLALHPRVHGSAFRPVRRRGSLLARVQGGDAAPRLAFDGERGIGKATFAYRAARFLLSREPGRRGAGRDACHIRRSHPAARQISRGRASLAVRARRDRGAAASAASIGVDEVRKLRSFLSLTSPGGWRAMIVDPANDLTIASANALLKAIEEPPPRTVILSHRPRRGNGDANNPFALREARLPAAEAAGFCRCRPAACAAGELETPDAQALEKLHAIAAGSPGRALEFIAGGLIPLAETLDRIVAACRGSTTRPCTASSNRRAEPATRKPLSRLCDLIEERIESLAREALAKPARSAGAPLGRKLWQTLAPAPRGDGSAQSR